MITKFEIESKIKELVHEQLGCNPDRIILQAKFVDDLGSDSLDVIELTMAGEEEFDIEISDDEIEKVSTVADAVNLVEKLLKEP